MAKTLTRAQLLGNAAELRSLLSTTGAHTDWTEESVLAYMRGEAAKYRPNALYYIAKVLPPYCQADLGKRLDLARDILMVACIAGTVGGALLSFILWLAGSSWARGALITAAIAVVVFVVSLMFDATWDKLVVLGPAAWQTQPFCLTEECEAPTDVRKVARAARSLMTDIRLEISLLFQGKWRLDPVLWGVVPTDSGEIRIPLRVWDEKGRPVLPH